MTYLSWTDEQWEEWEHKGVTVNQDELSRLCNLAEAFASGKRANRENRDKLMAFIASIKARIEPTPLNDIL